MGISDDVRGRMLLAVLAISVVVLVGVVGSIACKPAEIKETRFDNIVRVFWHEENRYSVMLSEPTTNRLKIVSFPEDGSNVELIRDVPAGSPMWAESRIKERGWGGPETILSLRIHIHSEKDIVGGGWNHGKLGRGKTTVVE